MAYTANWRGIGPRQAEGTANTRHGFTYKTADEAAERALRFYTARKHLPPLICEVMKARLLAGAVVRWPTATPWPKGWDMGFEIFIEET